MKKILFSALGMGLLATQAFALDVNSSWDDIKADWNYRAEAPQIGFAVPAGVDADGTYFVSVLDLSISADGKTIVTSKPVALTKTIHYGPGQEGNLHSETPHDVTVAVGSYVLETPTVFTAKVEDYEAEQRAGVNTTGRPSNWAGRIYKEVTYTYDEVYNIDVVKKYGPLDSKRQSGQYSDIGNLAFTKSFSFPVLK